MVPSICPSVLALGAFSISTVTKSASKQCGSLEAVWKFIIPFRMVFVEHIDFECDVDVNFCIRDYFGLNGLLSLSYR